MVHADVEERRKRSATEFQQSRLAAFELQTDQKLTGEEKEFEEELKHNTYSALHVRLKDPEERARMIAKYEAHRRKRGKEEEDLEARAAAASLAREQGEQEKLDS